MVTGSSKLAKKISAQLVFSRGHNFLCSEWFCAR